MPKASAKRKKEAKPELPQGVSAGNAPVARKGAPPKSDSGRSPFMLRFDNEVYEAVKELAERAGVSANQLMEGLSRWAIKNVKVGVPILNDDGEVIGEKVEQGSVWAGQVVEASNANPKQKRSVWMYLDFTNRRVVREDM